MLLFCKIQSKIKFIKVNSKKKKKNCFGKEIAKAKRQKEEIQHAHPSRKGKKAKQEETSEEKVEKLNYLFSNF